MSLLFLASHTFLTLKSPWQNPPSQNYSELNFFFGGGGFGLLPVESLKCAVYFNSTPFLIMCQLRAACLRSRWHFFHKFLFSIPCGPRESISVGRNQVPLALSFLNLFSESESLNNVVLCLHNSFEGALPLQSHKSEHPWKPGVVEEDFSALHLQSRWATEDHGTVATIAAHAGAN